MAEEAIREREQRVPASIRAGDVIAGRYHVVDLLAESRGGRFWRAHDAVLERSVALHLMGGDDERTPLLLEAAKRSVMVTDRRVLRVLDADSRDGLTYVVNEWGQGLSLDIMLATEGPCSPRRAAWLVGQVADVVAHAHEIDVTHGHLVPEHVLVDVTGQVRVIGLAVDAALSGLPPAPRTTDMTDLVGLLYAALTGRWAGASSSQVPAAPVENGHVLRPRQVRAGIPRSLDELCDEALNRVGAHTRGGPDTSTARGLADWLADFVGEPADLELEEARRASRRPHPHPPTQPRFTPVPPRTFPREEPADPEPDPPEEDAAEPGTPDPTDDTDGTADGDTRAEDDTRADGAATDTNDPDQATSGASRDVLATQAGMPLFLDDSDEVAWIAARSVPPPPPPPFEEKRAKPLFAPEPEEGQPLRRPRPGSQAEAQAQAGAEYWPWEQSFPSHTGSGTGTGAVPPITDDDEYDDGRVPGRTPLRLAMLIAASMLLMLALVMGWNLGRGRTPLGGVVDEPTQTPSASQPVVTPEPLTGLSATDFDPQGGDGAENPDTVGNVVDGDPETTWRTQTYNDPLGPPPGLKYGVGLQLDLGDAVEVHSVTIRFTEPGAKASLFLTDTAPDAVDGLDPVGTETANRRAVTFTLDEGSGGRYLTVWLTTLPVTPDGHRAEIAEIVVHS